MGAPRRGDPAAGVLTLGLSTNVRLTAAALAVTGFGFITQMAGTMTLLQGLAPVVGDPGQLIVGFAVHHAAQAFSSEDGIVYDSNL